MPMNLIDELMHTTVRIECENSGGGRSSGTGFICSFAQREGRNVPEIITNKHVVEGAVTGHFHMTVANAEGAPIYGDHVSIPISDFESLCIKHSNRDVDLAAFPLAPVLAWLSKEGKTPFYRSTNRDFWADDTFMTELSAVEEIVMIGYPNGLWDATNNLPIARRGTTATPPYIDFEGKSQFMIDCACFPGSSGSPIYLFNMGSYTPKEGGIVMGSRMKLLGILWGGPQYTAEGEIKVVPVPSAVQPIALSRIPNNLGYCIKAKELMEFETYFGKLLDLECKTEEAQKLARRTRVTPRVNRSNE